jgi:hypothetical protein
MDTDYSDYFLISTDEELEMPDGMPIWQCRPVRRIARIQGDFYVFWIAKPLRVRSTRNKPGGHAEKYIIIHNISGEKCSIKPFIPLHSLGINYLAVRIYLMRDEQGVSRCSEIDIEDTISYAECDLTVSLREAEAIVRMK